jgi:hypothetical protein
MTIVNCLECGTRIIDRATSCPRCGAKKPSHTAPRAQALNPRIIPRLIPQEKPNSGLALFIFFLIAMGFIILRPLFISLCDSIFKYLY